jgi:hypothetical protein
MIMENNFSFNNDKYGNIDVVIEHQHNNTLGIDFNSVYARYKDGIEKRIVFDCPNEVTQDFIKARINRLIEKRKQF